MENLAKHPWINKGDQDSGVDIPRAEKHFGAVYIADLCIRSGASTEDWTDYPVAVFWQEKPKQKTHKHYFGLFINGGNLSICDATCVSETEWSAVQAKDGEIIFSRFRHDYRVSRDQSAMIDGGKSGYVRYSGQPLILKIIGPDFVIDRVETF